MALLAAGAVSLAVPAPSLAEAEQESSEGGDSSGGDAPFGEQIEPGATVQDTAVVGTGTYVLPIPEVGEDHYFEVERSEPGQVIWYGVTALLGEPSQEGSLAVVGLADGDESQPCDDAIPQAEPLTYRTVLYNANRRSECREAESIVLRVQNREGILGPALPAGEDFYQLTVWTEPDVENRDELPGANEASPWVELEDRQGVEAQQVEGSTTFTDAEQLDDGGVYDLTVQQGRPAIFAFPLTYGQHAQVEVEVLEGADTFEDLEPVWVTPLGGQVRKVFPSGGPRPDLGIRGDDGPAGWSTPIVGYLNRERIGTLSSTEGTGTGGFQASPAAFAGTYFLVVEMPTNDDFSEFPEEITIRMSPQVVTDYEGTVPDYVQEPTPLSALDGSGFAATEEEEQAAREQQAEPAPWGLVGGLFAGAALLAVVGGIAIGRVMRRSS